MLHKYDNFSDAEFLKNCNSNRLIIYQDVFGGSYRQWSAPGNRYPVSQPCTLPPHPNIHTEIECL